MRILAELSILWLFKQLPQANRHDLKAPMMERPFGPVLQPQTCYHVISETLVTKGHCCGIRNFSLSR